MTTDPWPEPASMPLAFREGRLTPGGPYLIQINGVDVPRSLLDAVRKFTRSSAAEIDRLREALRQQQLRQQLAEREAADLRAEVERLTSLTRLLGPARMVLDRCAENAPGCAEEAGRMAQRIVDWIGHSVTDEPATASDLQAEVYRLQHLLYGDAGPDASDPDDSDTCADVAVDGDPVRVRGQHPLSPAASEAVAEVIRVTRARLAAPCAPWHVGQHRSPDCKAGSHAPCSGDGWCDLDDQQVLCSCACHGAVVPALAPAAAR